MRSGATPDSDGVDGARSNGFLVVVVSSEAAGEVFLAYSWAYSWAYTWAYTAAWSTAVASTGSHPTRSAPAHSSLSRTGFSLDPPISDG